MGYSERHHYEQSRVGHLPIAPKAFSVGEHDQRPTQTWDADHLPIAVKKILGCSLSDPIEEADRS